MYKETDAVTAFMQYKMGGNGYILHDNGEIWPFKDSFKQFDNARFIVDFPEEMKEPVTSGYIVPAEAETPEPASFTVAVTAETPEIEAQARKTESGRAGGEGDPRGMEGRRQVHQGNHGDHRLLVSDRPQVHSDQREGLRT